MGEEPFHREDGDLDLRVDHRRIDPSLELPPQERLGTRVEGVVPGVQRWRAADPGVHGRDEPPGHVLHLAAEDHDLAAIVAQVPHVSGPAAVRSSPIRLAIQLARAGLRDAIRAAFGRSPYRVPAVGKPGDVAMMTQDVVTPVKVAVNAAKRIPRAEIKTYDCSHFEPYLDPYFDTVVGDQIGFLTRTLG